MTAMPNSHLFLHKETLKQYFEKKISIKHLIKINNLGAINCPVGRNGLINALLTFHPRLTLIPRPFCPAESCPGVPEIRKKID